MSAAFDTGRDGRSSYDVGPRQNQDPAGSLQALTDRAMGD